jgi:hypothetical protein
MASPSDVTVASDVTAWNGNASSISRTLICMHHFNLFSLSRVAYQSTICMIQMIKILCN